MLHRPRRWRCSTTGWRHTCSAAATKLFDSELCFFFLVIISPPEQWSLQCLWWWWSSLQCFDTVGWVAERASSLCAGMVICLERGAALHMVQLMPLPLTVSCSSKIKMVFTFLVPAHPGSPGQSAVKRVCVCMMMMMMTDPGVVRVHGVKVHLDTWLPRRLASFPLLVDYILLVRLLQLMQDLGQLDVGLHLLLNLLLVDVALCLSQQWAV